MCLLSLVSLIFLKEIQPSTKRAKSATDGSGIYDSAKYSHSGSGFYSGGGSGSYILINIVYYYYYILI